jgi:hypothetical protein
MQKRVSALLTILILCGLLFAPMGAASAQGPGPGGKKFPVQRTHPASVPPAEPLAQGDKLTNLVGDPSLELSYTLMPPYWYQSSTNFGTPLCIVADCTNGGGTAGPRSGNVWSWFGGVNFSQPGTVSPEIGAIYQNVVFPACSATLQFYLWIGLAAAGSDANDYFAVRIDGNTVFTANATQKSSYPTYKLVSVNVSAYANGAAHEIRFYSNISGQLVTFNLDDVALYRGNCSIAGTTTVGGVTLSYTDGAPKTATSRSDGYFSFGVPYNWTGTVTPSHPCFNFIPNSQNYGPVTHNYAGFTFTPDFKVGSGCADINVLVGGALRGRLGIPSPGSTRASFIGLNSGPVKIESTNAVPLIGAERLLYKVNNVATSFTEMLGLPANQLNTIYWLPWYNNVDLDTQLRIANATGSVATVHVFIGANEMTGSPFTLGAGESTRKSYAGVNAGPVKIVSDQNIVAAERLLYKVNNVATSFTEVMGLPNSGLNTTFWLPWYNNVDLDTQLRIANVTSTPASVHVFIGGAEMTGSPFPLAAGESTRKSYAGINAGPVQIVSDQNIVAAERLIFKVNNVPTSFTEMLALPASQVNTTYWLPWYNNVELDTQLRFANVHASQTATVHVFVGGNEMTGSPFTLGVGGSTRKSFAGINAGPVQIVSDVPIVVAERLLYKVNNVAASFSEMMALPNNQLDTVYWLPWYNNVDLDTQLRFGVP